MNGKKTALDKKHTAERSGPSRFAAPLGTAILLALGAAVAGAAEFTVTATTPAPGNDPPGLRRLEFVSAVDKTTDWAMALPPTTGTTWVVHIHGHSLTGSQLWTQPDARQTWLPEFQRHHVGVLTPNLRGNSWMSPAAAQDLKDLLNFIRAKYGARQFVFVSGSMGGTANLIYAGLHPEDVAGVVALCPATDLASYDAWCRTHGPGLVKQIADAIEGSYGGTPLNQPDVYAAHSAVALVPRLRMPIFVVHGTMDPIIPVSQSRRLAAAMGDANNFVYQEIPDGDHGAPVRSAANAVEWVMRRVQGASPPATPDK